MESFPSAAPSAASDVPYSVQQVSLTLTRVRSILVVVTPCSSSMPADTAAGVAGAATIAVCCGGCHVLSCTSCSFNGALMLFSPRDLLTAAHTCRVYAVTHSSTTVHCSSVVIVLIDTLCLLRLQYRCFCFRTWPIGALKLTGIRILRWHILLVPCYFASRRASSAPHLRLTLKAIDISSVS